MTSESSTTETEPTVADAPVEQDTEQSDVEQPDTDKRGAEAAKYRRRLRETETERDGLAERLTMYQRREAERLAAEHLVRADDVWLGGADVATVLGEDGEVDPAKVAVVATAVLDGRPQLGKSYRPRPKPDEAQGSGPGKASTSWSNVLKGQ